MTTPPSSPFGKWLDRLDEPVRSLVLARGRRARFQAGQWIYGQGDEPTGLVIVLEGLLRIEAAVGDRLALIGTARAGEVLGQSRRRGGGPRLVTARAGRDSHVLMLSDAVLEAIGVAHPEVWRSVNLVVYSQLDASIQALAQVLALKPRARIAARLLAFSDTGVAPLTQADLAELCGLSRKTTSGHLGALERAGAIACGYGEIVITNLELLERLAL
jgi:CRP-like cAMP-binding protein